MNRLEDPAAVAIGLSAMSCYIIWAPVPNISSTSKSIWTNSPQSL